MPNPFPPGQARMGLDFFELGSTEISMTTRTNVGSLLTEMAQRMPSRFASSSRCGAMLGGNVAIAM